MMSPQSAENRLYGHHGIGGCEKMDPRRRAQLAAAKETRWAFTPPDRSGC